MYTPQSYGTCHMRSQCYLPPDTRERTPPNPSQKGRFSINLPHRDGRLSWPRWLVTYRDGLPARRRSPIQVLSQATTNCEPDHARLTDFNFTSARKRLNVDHGLVNLLLYWIWTAAVGQWTHVLCVVKLLYDMTVALQLICESFFALAVI